MPRSSPPKIRVCKDHRLENFISRVQKSSKICFFQLINIQHIYTLSNICSKHDSGFRSHSTSEKSWNPWNSPYQSITSSCITSCTCLASCSSPNTLRGPRVEIKASRRPQSCPSSMAQSHICSSHLPQMPRSRCVFEVVQKASHAKTRMMGEEGLHDGILKLCQFVPLWGACFGHCITLLIQNGVFWTGQAKLLSLLVRATMPPCPSNVCRLRTCWCWTPSAKTWRWCSHVDSSELWQLLLCSSKIGILESSRFVFRVTSRHSSSRFRADSDATARSRSSRSWRFVTEVSSCRDWVMSRVVESSSNNTWGDTVTPWMFHCNETWRLWSSNVPGKETSLLFPQSSSLFPPDLAFLSFFTVIYCETFRFLTAVKSQIPISCYKVQRTWPTLFTHLHQVVLGARCILKMKTTATQTPTFLVP